MASLDAENGAPNSGPSATNALSNSVRDDNDDDGNRTTQRLLEHYTSLQQQLRNDFEKNLARSQDLLMRSFQRDLAMAATGNSPSGYSVEDLVKNAQQQLSVQQQPHGDNHLVQNGHALPQTINSTQQQPRDENAASINNAPAIDVCDSDSDDSDTELPPPANPDASPDKSTNVGSMSPHIPATAEEMAAVMVGYMNSVALQGVMNGVGKKQSKLPPPANPDGSVSTLPSSPPPPPPSFLVPPIPGGDLGKLMGNSMRTGPMFTMGVPNGSRRRMPPGLYPGEGLGDEGQDDIGDGKEGESKKVRVRASKLEFKRLDELYNKAIHDFYLAESSKTPSAKTDKWEEYVFVVRRRFDWQNKYLKTFVDIKSIHLRSVLRDVLKDVAGVPLREDKPTIEPNLLFNYLPDIESALTKEKELPEDSKDKTKIQHLELLVEYIVEDYADVSKQLYPLLEHHEITFDLLWALFLPNTLLYVVCAGSNEPRCLKMDWGEIRSSMQRGKFFYMDCHYVDYDGKSFGEANAVLEIDQFRGTRRIDSLPVFPLAYHENEEALREKLITRGRKFGALKGMHYRFYKGLAFYKKKRAAVRVNVNGRIMVDPLTFRRINPNYRMSPVKDGATSYSGGGGGREFDDLDDDDGLGGCGHDDDDDDDINSGTIGSSSRSKPNPSDPLDSITKMVRSSMGRRPNRTYVLGLDGKMKLVGDEQKKLKAETNGKETLLPETMTEEQLLLCSPTVLGFSFGDKLWAEFAVEHIAEIEFDTDAFNSLVLPENQKTIVKALVESHSGKEGKKKIGIDDVIKGKGKGLVAVLHGRPGVGKTLTAEGISEYLKRPLYMVSAGELGTNSAALEQQLSRILDVAHVWGAVLLLDEADVFLERRSVHDIHRNALVSIFLRLLEYFQGILFLTTNRVETFDEAFQSRIHIAVRYNDLDRKAKRIIWTTFLNMVAREEISLSDDPKKSRTPREILTKDELDSLSRRSLNGRQIKNVVRTSQALAGNMGEDLGWKHLELVLGVTEGFEHDLKGTGQLDGMMSYA